MERDIQQVKFNHLSAPKLIRVAAYARVSSAKDAMHHSLMAQVSYYRNLIENRSDWQFVGVYADEAKTGTKDTRENFVRLLVDCREGKIDLILTKTISRFARNTVTLLETVRALKDMGVGVFFEEQNIHTLSGDGELMLSILASYAQEESYSASENQKWKIRKKFEEGIPCTNYMLGYKNQNGRFVIVPEEAELVRRIYNEYLSGKGYTLIAKELTESGILTKKGQPWRWTTIAKILNNYSYTGNLILQTTYRENHITKKTKRNYGELPKYHAQDTHEAIIPLETFNRVQTEITKRTTSSHSKPKRYPLSGKITCEKCGKKYRRKTITTGIVWICTTYNTYGKAYCPSKQIPEATLLSVVSSITDDIEKVERIIACDGNRLIIRLTDGKEIATVWQDRSRSESWTDEMKEKARRQTLRRNNDG